MWTLGFEGNHSWLISAQSQMISFEIFVKEENMLCYSCAEGLKSIGFSAWVCVYLCLCVYICVCLCVCILHLSLYFAPLSACVSVFCPCVCLSVCILPHTGCVCLCVVWRYHRMVSGQRLPLREGWVPCIVPMPRVLPNLQTTRI